MIYDNICAFLMEQLEGNYDIRYNNNKDFEWEDLIVAHENYVNDNESDRPVLGVLRVENVENTYVSDEVVRTEQLSVALAIPNNRKFVEAQIKALNSLPGLSGVRVAGDNSNQSAELYFGNRTEGEITSIDVNGVSCDVVLTTIFITSVVFEGVVTSNDVSVTINSTTLNGEIEVVYDFSKQVEANSFKGTDMTADGTATQLNDVLNITCVMSKNNTILSTLMTDERSLKNYTIKYNNGIVERTLSLQLQGINEVTTKGSISKCTLKFVNGSKTYAS